MTWAMHQLILGIHILFGIIWVGGVLFVGWGVYPAVKKINVTEQRQFLTALMNWTHRLFTLAGIGTIGTGVILGTVAGPIRHWQDIWHTSYGQTWFTVLITAILTLCWGVFVGYRQTMKVLENDTIWNRAEAGNTKRLNKAMAFTTLVASVEVAGFLFLLAGMLIL